MPTLMDGEGEGHDVGTRDVVSPLCSSARLLMSSRDNPVTAMTAAVSCAA